MFQPTIRIGAAVGHGAVGCHGGNSHVRHIADGSQRLPPKAQRVDALPAKSRGEFKHMRGWVGVKMTNQKVEESSNKWVGGSEDD